jgi:hypothetical protein
VALSNQWRHTKATGVHRVSDSMLTSDAVIWATPRHFFRRNSRTQPAAVAPTSAIVSVAGSGVGGGFTGGPTGPTVVGGGGGEGRMVGGGPCGGATAEELPANASATTAGTRYLIGQVASKGCAPLSGEWRHWHELM